MRDEGIAIGEARGETKKLVRQIRKKIEKEMSAGEISELLEEEPALVVSICDLIKTHPKWSDDKICEKIFQNKKKIRKKG